MVNRWRGLRRAARVALRLTAKLRNNPAVELTLADRPDYHQTITELPRAAGGHPTLGQVAGTITFEEFLATRPHAGEAR